jgi:multimeric flavodoxin WrbA
MRWLEAEDIIRETADLAYCYAKYVIKGQWKEAEGVIMSSPYYWCQYEKNVLKLNI